MKNNKRYFLVITLCVLLICVFNLLFYFSAQAILFCLIAFAIISLPCVAIMFIVRLLPNKWFDPNKKIFHVFKFESELYENFNIRKWKNRLFEPGRLILSLDKRNANTPTHLETFMLIFQQNCKSGVCHIVCFFWGFLSLFVVKLFVPYPFILTAGLLIASIHGTMHLASFFAIRYMRPRLVKLYQLKKEQLQKHNPTKREAENIKILLHSQRKTKKFSRKNNFKKDRFAKHCMRKKASKKSQTSI